MFRPNNLALACEGLTPWIVPADSRRVEDAERDWGDDGDEDIENTEPFTPGARMIERMECMSACFPIRPYKTLILMLASLIGKDDG